MKLINIAARNIFRNRRRSLLSMIAIAIAAMSIVLLFAILDGMTEDMGYNIQTYQTGEIRIRHVDYDKNEMLNPLHLNIKNLDGLLSHIEGIEGVESLVPRTNFPIAIFKNNEQFTGLAMGTDVEREEAFQDLSGSLTEGRAPLPGANEAVIGIGFAEKLGITTGDKITFMTMSQTRSTQALTVTITGLINFPYPSLNDMYLILPIDRAQRTLRMTDSSVDVLVKVSDDYTSDEIAALIQTFMQDNDYENIVATPWEKIDTSYALLLIATTIYNFFAIFFFVLGSTVVITTTMMVIYERIREIGTLGAMGMEGNEIVRMFFMEAALLGFAGSLIGVFLGSIFSIILSYTGIDFTAAMQGIDFEISGVMYTKPSLWRAVFVFFYSFAVSAFASFIPSRRASKIKPVEALRSI